MLSKQWWTFGLILQIAHTVGTVATVCMKLTRDYCKSNLPTSSLEFQEVLKVIGNTGKVQTVSITSNSALSKIWPSIIGVVH